MTILFRYLFREYAKIFTMCFSGLMTVYLVIDFFEKVRRFLRYDANWLDVLTYFILKVPAISFQIAPLAILMATLLTFGLLSAAMKSPPCAAAVSAYSGSQPVYCLCHRDFSRALALQFDRHPLGRKQVRRD